MEPEAISQEQLEQALGLPPLEDYPAAMVCERPGCSNPSYKRKGKKKSFYYRRFCSYACSVYAEEGLSNWQKYLRVEKWIINQGKALEARQEPQN